MSHSHLTLEQALQILREKIKKHHSCEICDQQLKKARAVLSGISEAEINHPDLDKLNHLPANELLKHYESLETNTGAKWLRYAIAALVFIAISGYLIIQTSLQPVLIDGLQASVNIKRVIWGVTFNIKKSDTIRLNDTITISQKTSLPEIAGYKITAGKRAVFQFQKDSDDIISLVLKSERFVVDYQASEKKKRTYLSNLSGPMVQVLGTRIFFVLEKQSRALVLLKGNATLKGEQVAPKKIYSIAIQKIESKPLSKADHLLVFGNEFKEINTHKKKPALKRSKVKIILYNGEIIEDFIKQNLDEEVILASGRKIAKTQIKTIKSLKK